MFGRTRPRGRCPRVTAVRCFTTHLGIRLRRILRCAASGASGTRPLGLPSFWGSWGQNCSPCLADTCCKVRLCAAQEVPRRQEGAFFFTKKAYCGNQTVCVAESQKSVQTQPHPFSAPKKALENNGNPRGIPPRCVVKRRTAEPRDSVSRPCPSNTQRSS